MKKKTPSRGGGRFPNGLEGPECRRLYLLAAQGFLAAHGFFAAHGFLAAQGFFAAQGFLAAHGFFAAHGPQAAIWTGASDMPAAAAGSATAPAARAATLRTVTVFLIIDILPDDFAETSDRGDISAVH
jgi:hypothetical protein